MPYNTDLLFFNPESICLEERKSRSVIVHIKKISGRRKKMSLKKYFYIGDKSEELSQIKNTQNEPNSNYSAPDFRIQHKIINVRSSCSLTIQKTKAYNLKYIVNHVSEYRVPDNSNLFGRVRQPIKWRVYRCQFGAQEESCCCSCNSDAMFEVMKSLYDCYKKKNCDHCDCILCGHLPRQERQAGEARKSGIYVSSTASMKDKAEKIKNLAQTLEGKSPIDKEKILRKMAMDGIPLPEGKSPSEKELIKKVRNDVGLPPEPASPEETAKLRKAELRGMVVPLEGKSPAEKEKILRKQASLGLPFPIGRTPSEKALIDKIRSETPKKAVGIPSDKLQKAKTAGFLTPLEGKSPADKEKILRGLAMSGIPLPEGKTPTEKKLIEKVRNDVGLPTDPKSAADKEKYKQGVTNGVIEPLEGKTLEQKEKILKRQLDSGLPLPEGRTPSEKALIAKVRATGGKAPAGVPSEKLRKAKAEGFLTPLAGKTPEQKEKILRGLVKHGIALPEPKTTSDKNLIDQIKKELGLPAELKSRSGFPVGISSEKLRKAKAEGLVTPLIGKTPEQKEKILRGLAKIGIPLPEAKTSSEKKLIDKVRKELGLPPEPKSPSMRDKYNKALAQGLVTPLEGKSTAQKEKILKGLVQAGLPLPEDRTASEKALINKVKAETGYKTPARASLAGIASEKLRKAKAAGLLTPLAGKTPEQKEKILKGLVKQGIPLPEGKTSSEKKLIDKVRKELGLPPEPKSPSMRDKYNKALAQGLVTPLEGKSTAQKEKILKGLVQAGLPLPEDRTASEKALINKVKAETGYKTPARASLAGIASEKLRKAKAAGLLTPLAGKTPEQKEKILKGLGKQGIPLPEGKTSSEKKLIDKVRKELGLPPEPKSPSMRDKYNKALAQGLVTPLEGKSTAQKEKILKGLVQAGLPLPEDRTASEKALINKVKAETGYKTPARASLAGIASEKLRKAKAAGLLTPLAGKTPEQKEKILKGLGKQGIPLPEGKTSSEKKLIDKVRKELGLPPEPKSPSMRDKYNKALAQGLVTPLKGKSTAQKEKILKGLVQAGLPLPEDRTASEKALINKVKAETGYKTPARASLAGIASEKLRKAKAAGLLTPLAGKTPEQKEKILKGLGKQGIPLPEGKTSSEKKLIDKVRKELGLPPEPKSPSMRHKYNKALAQGLVTPLEGKSTAQKEKILKGLVQAGLPLPEDRTASEKALINKVKAETGYKTPARASLAGIASEKLGKAKAAGLLTPLAGKTPEQKEKILKGLAAHGIPLPVPQTPSEKKLVDKIRNEMGTPKTPSVKERLRKAQATGIISPLEGKTPAQKEKIIRNIVKAGMPLPEGKTPSEKVLINKIKAEVKPIPSAMAPKGKMLPLSEEAQKLDKETAKVMKEGKGPSDECICGLLTPKLEQTSIPTSPAKTLSEKIRKAKAGVITPTAAKVMGIPSEKLRKAKAAGLLTPLTGKSLEQKEKILKGLAKQGIPLPEAETPSEKKLIEKVRNELGLPPEPKSSSIREKYNKALAQGIITPLEGKTPAQKEKIFKSLAQAGIPLPEGRTPSEKALINKVKAEIGYKTPARASLAGIASEKLRKAKAAGLLTPLAGKTPEQKEKILKGLGKQGIPLPEGKTSSEKKLIDKVRKELGLPPEPKSPSMRDKYNKALAQGLVTPLEGKSTAQKEKILKGLVQAGLPLPEDRTASEKALINKVKAETGYKTPARASLAGIASEKLRKAKAAGLLTPLAGKTPEQKEKILKGLAKQGIPLPEAETPSEKKLIEKVRNELGLPPEPKSSSIREKYNKALAQGIITPLEGKTPAQKEKIFKSLAQAGIPLPEGRTPSEKALINKVKAEIGYKTPSEVVAIPSKKQKAKAAGLLTPLEGKSPEQKEKILRGLAMQGLPFPLAKTESDKNLAVKIRAALGMPPEPKNTTEKYKYEKALAKGIVLPLEGKNHVQKEKILRDLYDQGIELPVGRTPSEKALIAKIKAEPTPQDKLKKAKAAGLLTPLDGKTPAQKEKILRALVEKSLPLPEGKTPSEKALIQKIKGDFGIPPEAITPSEKVIVAKAKADGLLTPLTGKTLDQKEKILKGLTEAGLPLPEGKTVSEKALIKQFRTAAGLPPEPTPSEKDGKIKKKDRKIGAKRGASSAIGVKRGESGAKAAGIDQKYTDIEKKTKCDRGCGCDKKKIRFKHSYVKIKVTSPDISSLCPCPEECIPGVKNGVFIDNEGIKVTVGSAIGYPSLSIHDIHRPSNKELKKSSSEYSNSTEKCNSQTSSKSTYGEQNYTDGDTYASEIEKDSSTDCNIDNYLQNKSYDFIIHNFDSHYEMFKKIIVSKHKLNNFHNTKISISCISVERSFTEVTSKETLSSTVMIRTDSSLSFSTNFTGSIKTISLISLHNSSIITTSSHYICYPESVSDSMDEDDSEYLTNEVDYITADVPTSESDNITKSLYYTSNTSYRPKRHKPSKNYNKNIFTCKMLNQDVDNGEKHNISSQKKHKPIIIINELNRDSCDVMKIVQEVMSEQNLCKTSSIIVVVPTSDEDDDEVTNSDSSTICISLSEIFYSSKNKFDEKTVQYQRSTKTGRGIKFISKEKYNFKNATTTDPIPSYSKDNYYNSKKMTETLEIEHRKQKRKVNKKCQVMEERLHKGNNTSFCMDTSQDRPCCCIRPDPADSHKMYRYCLTNVISDVITPIIVSQGLDQETYPDLDLTCQTSFLNPNHATSVSRCKVYPCAESTRSQKLCEKNTDAQNLHGENTQKQKLAGGNTHAQNPQNSCERKTQEQREMIPIKFTIKGRLAKQSQPTECPACDCVKENNNDFGCTLCGGKGVDKKRVGFTPIVQVEPQDNSCSTCIDAKKHKLQNNSSFKEDSLCEGDNETTLNFKSTSCQCCLCDIPSASQTGLALKKRSAEEAQRAKFTEQTINAQNAKESIEKTSEIDQNITSIESTCQCDLLHKLRNRLWRRSKNIECECRPPGKSPQEAVEEEEIDYSQYAGIVYVTEEDYLRQTRQKQTELTERTSGFRIVWQKRSPDSSEMSFEEALKYYEEHPEDNPQPNGGNEADDCPCGPYVKYPEDAEDTAARKKGPSDTGVVCECPYNEDDDLEKDKTEDIKGLKLRIDGKGTGSKGLSGICCFDMIQESNHLISLQ